MRARCGSWDVTIVGAGMAGRRRRFHLRQLVFQGSIGLIGAEAELPDERPPLSKDYLTGEKAFERMLIRPGGVLERAGRDLVPRYRDQARRSGRKHRGVGVGESGSATEPGVGRRAGCRGGSSCEGGDLAGVHVVRCKAEVDGILAELRPARGWR